MSFAARSAVVALPCLLLACLLAVGATPPVLAEDLPPEITALDAEDPATRADAVLALRKAENWKTTVTGILWDDEARGQLGEEALVSLCQLVREQGLSFAHGGLRKLLRNPTGHLRARKLAAVVLGEKGGLANVGALGDALLDLPDEACRALVAIGGKSAERALRRGAGQEPPPAALAAFARFGDDSGLPELVDRLDNDPEGTVELLRWATGRKLPPTRKAWEQHLRRRTLAAGLALEDSAAATVVVRKIVAALRGGDAEETAADLTDVLADPSWQVFARDKAALCLGLGGVKAAAGTLLATSRNKQPGSLRLYSVEALSRVGDLSCAVSLANMLVHDEDRDRLKAKRGAKGEYFPVDPAMVRTLYRLGVKGGVTQIATLLGGRYRTRMHRDCMRALREVTGGETFGLEPDSAAPQRTAAAGRITRWWALNRERISVHPREDDSGWPKFREEVDGLIEKLGTFKFLHQLRAKNALVILAEPAGAQLEKALWSENLHVRMGASEVMAAAGLRSFVAALTRRLTEEDNAAAQTKFLVALAACTGPRAEGTPPLSRVEEVRVEARRALGSTSVGSGALDVRIAGARLLGQVGAAEIDVAALARARALPRNAVSAFRTVSAAALLQLGDPSAVGDLLAELLVADVARRADAAAALGRAGVDVSGYDPDAGAEDRTSEVDHLRAVLLGKR